MSVAFRLLARLGRHLLPVLLPAAAVAQTSSLPPVVQVRAVAPDVFVHTSFHYLPGNPTPVPSNGLIVRTSQGALLLDTAWDPAQTRQLLRWVADNLHQRIQAVVLTHAHEDRAGGLAALQEQRIKVYSSPLTAQRLRRLHPAVAGPTPALQPYTRLRAGRTRLDVFFAGPAHTPDNVVVWLPRQKVLFGGCLVREAAATSLGNLQEANLAKWPATLDAVVARYGRARTVVPGHGQWGGPELLVHTADLLRETILRKPSTALHEPKPEKRSSEAK